MDYCSDQCLSGELFFLLELVDLIISRLLLTDSVFLSASLKREGNPYFRRVFGPIVFGDVLCCYE